MVFLISSEIKVLEITVLKKVAMFWKISENQKKRTPVLEYIINKVESKSQLQKWDSSTVFFSVNPMKVLKICFNSFMTEVPIIHEPVHWLV